MMYAATAGVGQRERPRWDALYRDLCGVTGYDPARDNSSIRGEEMLAELIQQLTSSNPDHEDDIVDAEVIDYQAGDELLMNLGGGALSKLIQNVTSLNLDRNDDF